MRKGLMISCQYRECTIRTRWGEFQIPGVQLHADMINADYEGECRDNVTVLLVAVLEVALLVALIWFRNAGQDIRVGLAVAIIMVAIASVPAFYRLMRANLTEWKRKRDEATRRRGL